MAMAKVVSRSKGRTIPKRRAVVHSRGKPAPPKTLDLSHFKKLLISERQRLTEERGRIRNRAQQAEGTLPADENWEVDEDSADISASMFEKEINVSLEGNIEEMIESVDTALRKIKDKTYGVCDMCGRTIAKLRLERIPFATLCVDCQSLVERM